MAFNQTAKDLYQRYKNKQLMSNYFSNKAKLEQPSSEFMNKIGANLPEQMSFKTPLDNALGTNGATVNQGSKLAEGLGKAGSVAGGVMSGLGATNEIANGDYINGGLNAAKTAASFIPGGQPIAAAIQVGQAVKDLFFPDRSQEMMQKSMEEAIKSQQASQQALEEKQQGFDEVKQENMQKMQAQQQNANQDNQTIVFDMLNRLYDNQQTQPQIQASQPTIEQPMPEQTQGNNNLVQDILGQVQNLGGQGNVTGGAAPASMPTNYAEESMPTMTPEELALIEQQNQQPQQNQQEEIKRSLLDKFKSGLNDFSAGYQDNTNTDFAHGDLMNNVTGGAAPIQTSGNSFNLGATQNRKGVMARLGEAVGTGQRIMSNPLTQAAIAGMVSKAAGGDIDDIAKAAYQYGTKKANADRYYQQVTGNTNRPFLNTYSAQDVTNKRLEDALIQRQQQYNQARQDKIDQQNWERNYRAEKDERDYNYKVNKDKEDRAIKREEVAARKKYWETRGGNDRGNNVAQQKYDYQQGFNKSVGQFQKYADTLAKAKEKDGWFASSNDKAAIAQAQEQYDKAREFMVNTYGGDFIKYAKEQGWE